MKITSTNKKMEIKTKYKIYKDNYCAIHEVTKLKMENAEMYYNQTQKVWRLIRL